MLVSVVSIHVDIQVQTIKQVVVVLAKEGGRSGFVVLGG